MKTKVKMTCVLKSGVKLTDTIKVDRNDKVRKTIMTMQKEIENYMRSSNAEGGQITWGTTTIIKLSEIAAISFKE